MWIYLLYMLPLPELLLCAWWSQRNPQDTWHNLQCIECKVAGAKCHISHFYRPALSWDMKSGQGKTCNRRFMTISIETKLKYTNMFIQARRCTITIYIHPERLWTLTWSDSDGHRFVGQRDKIWTHLLEKNTCLGLLPELMLKQRMLAAPVRSLPSGPAPVTRQRSSLETSLTSTRASVSSFSRRNPRLWSLN
jgi:hypothetical protein